MSGLTPDVGAGFPGEDLPGEYRFSMFRSMADMSPETVTLADLRMFISEGLCAELVDRIRAEPDKARRSELKRGLPCVTISGEFAVATRPGNWCGTRGCFAWTSTPPTIPTWPAAPGSGATGWPRTRRRCWRL